MFFFRVDSDNVDWGVAGEFFDAFTGFGVPPARVTVEGGSDEVFGVVGHPHVFDGGFVSVVGGQ